MQRVYNQTSYQLSGCTTAQSVRQTYTAPVEDDGCSKNNTSLEWTQTVMLSLYRSSQLVKTSLLQLCPTTLQSNLPIQQEKRNIMMNIEATNRHQLCRFLHKLMIPIQTVNECQVCWNPNISTEQKMNSKGAVIITKPPTPFDLHKVSWGVSQSFKQQFQADLIS